ncbi:hypothetical protein ACQ86N_16880 [Puia sp. P3]|uniref:hypothetical protein n=1 Tax=Puia sp. P3 TaxID=3423952 RepID=UPI003D66CB5E
MVGAQRTPNSKRIWAASGLTVISEGRYDAGGLQDGSEEERLNGRRGGNRHRRHVAGRAARGRPKAVGQLPAVDLEL